MCSSASLNPEHSTVQHVVMELEDEQGGFCCVFSSAATLKGI